MRVVFDKTIYAPSEVERMKLLEHFDLMRLNYNSQDGGRIDLALPEGEEFREVQIGYGTAFVLGNLQRELLLQRSLEHGELLKKLGSDYDLVRTNSSLMDLHRDGLVWSRELASTPSYEKGRFIARGHIYFGPLYKHARVVNHGVFVGENQ